MDGVNVTNMIYEYDCGIYPRKLWVSIGVSNEEINEFFTGCDYIPPMEDNYYAETRVVNKGKLGGYLIRFPNKKEVTPENVAHEAGHVAIRMFNVIESEISITTSEPFCYLLDWVVSCVFDAKNQK